MKRESRWVERDLYLRLWKGEVKRSEKNPRVNVDDSITRIGHHMNSTDTGV